MNLIEQSKMLIEIMSTLKEILHYVINENKMEEDFFNELFKVIDETGNAAIQFTEAIQLIIDEIDNNNNDY